MRCPAAAGRLVSNRPGRRAGHAWGGSGLLTACRYGRTGKGMSAMMVYAVVVVPVASGCAAALPEPGADCVAALRLVAVSAVTLLAMSYASFPMRCPYPKRSFIDRCLSKNDLLQMLHVEKRYIPIVCRYCYAGMPEHATISRGKKGEHDDTTIPAT